jgi:DNA-binding protein HU-beta
MNKQQLVDNIAKVSNLTKKDTEAFLGAFTDVVTNALVNGDDVNLTGFGKFETRERAERTGRNPSTGASITIPKSVAAAFKPGKQLKDAVKG